jgi:hypothetical protein
MDNVLMQGRAGIFTLTASEKSKLREFVLKRWNSGTSIRQKL